jgi:hypothetical protein
VRKQKIKLVQKELEFAIENIRNESEFILQGFREATLDEVILLYRTCVDFRKGLRNRHPARITEMDRDFWGNFRIEKDGTLAEVAAENDFYKLKAHERFTYQYSRVCPAITIGTNYKGKEKLLAFTWPSSCVVLVRPKQDERNNNELLRTENQK